MKTISYYELLEMIKVGEYPIVEYKNIEYIPDFDNVDGSFLDYQKGQNQNNYSEGEFYLVENLLDCEMFDKVLTIVEQAKPKENKKINRVERKAKNLTNKYIKDKLNEIIDRLNGE